MLRESLEYLDCQSNGVYVDGTLGAAGHSLEILRHSAPNGRLIGIDWDNEALEIAIDRLKEFQDRVSIVRDNFKNIGSILENLKIDEVDGILLDLGVSSIQLENKERGFSFTIEGPIDMRMDRSSALRALDLVNGLSPSELQKIIWKYGEERFAKRIATFITDNRKIRPITTTTQLADIVTAAVPSRFHPKRIHPATKTFQAIRIAVNDELTNLDIAVHESTHFLRRGGRFCIISFHSLEDRIVKQAFRSLAKGCTCPPDMPECNCQEEARVRILTKKPVSPSHEEKRINPRSRSAKLRAVEKL